MKFNKRAYHLIRLLGGLKFAKFISRKHPKIIMYHRVSENGGVDSVSADSFRKQIRIIKNHFNPLTFSQLMKASQEGKVPNNAVVVTIDDGYKDFSEYAWPILMQEDVAATLFITTGFVNRELWLWPDKIKYVLNHSNKRSLYVPFYGELEISENKDEVWHKLANFCLTLENEKKNTLIDWLFDELGVNKPTFPPKFYEALSWDQIRVMVSQGLDIGSHSHSHPILTKLDDTELDFEINKSKQLIFDNLGFEANSFCYPNGTKSDFNSYIKHCIVRGGYDYAIVAYPDLLPLKDPLEINRYPGTQSLSLFEKNVYGLSYIWSDFSRRVIKCIK